MSTENQNTCVAQATKTYLVVYEQGSDQGEILLWDAIKSIGLNIYIVDCALFLKSEKTAQEIHSILRAAVKSNITIFITELSSSDRAGLIRKDGWAFIEDKLKTTPYKLSKDGKLELDT